MRAIGLSISTLALILAGGLVALLGASYLGGVLAPLDILAPLRWHLLCGAAGIGLAATGRRWALPALVCGALAAVLAPPLRARLATVPLTVTSSSPGGASAHAAATPLARRHLVIAALNTWDQVHNEAQVTAFVEASGADLIVLGEVSPPKRALLTRLEGRYPWQVHCANSWPCSMALVSRIRFADAGTVEPSRDRPAMVWAHLAGEAGGVTVVGTHVHRPSRNPWLHLRHVDGLARFLGGRKGALIVAGDFNAPLASASLQDLQRRAALRPAAPDLPTWPAWPAGPLPLAQFAIDHILAAHEVEVVAAGLGPYAGSDHLPVVARLVLPVEIEGDGR